MKYDTPGLAAKADRLVDRITHTLTRDIPKWITPFRKATDPRELSLLQRLARAVSIRGKARGAAKRKARREWMR